MRITNNMMISNMNRNLQQNIRKLDKTQMQYNTGKRIHKPSDDPVGITRSLKIRADISELAQFKKNVEDATSWLENTEQAVVNNSEALKRLRDLMVQGANGVLTSEETKKIQSEVAEIKKQIINVANTTYSGNYIFSGKNTDKKLLGTDGSYEVDMAQFLDPSIVDHRINYEVGIGEYIPINTVGASLFEAADLTMNVQLPKVDGESKGIEFLGAKIKVTANSTNPADPDAPMEYDLDINIAGVGSKTYNALSDGDAIYKKIQETFSGIDDPTKFDKDAVLDASVTPTEAWNKLLIDRNIPADINNLTFATHENSGKAVGIVAKPQKAGLINLIERIEKNLIEGNYEQVSDLLGPLDRFLDKSLIVRGDIGSKINRTELILNRIEDDTINLRALQSKLEDADVGETAIRLMNEENVYRASLAVGARIIQPTLLDFLR